MNQKRINAKVFITILLIFSFQNFSKIIYTDLQMGSQKYLVRSWTLENGLPQNSVLCLLQDQKGYIWLGTSSGLARFDGRFFHIFNRWTTKNLKSDWIISLYQDFEGRLWVGTNGGGLSCLNQGKWSSYTTENGLSNNTIRTITEDINGNLWIGTNNGLNYLDIKKNTFNISIVPKGFSGYSITSLKVFTDGTLWIGSDGGGLHIMKKGQLVRSNSDLLPYDSNINIIFEDNQKDLWVGTDKGLFFLKNGELHTNKLVQHLSKCYIKTIIQDHQGNFWIGTDGDGLFHYNPQKEIISSSNIQYGFHIDFIQSLLEDQEGNLWMGSITNGLIRLKLAKVSSITTIHGLPENRIPTILQDPFGFLWCGTYRKGLVKIDWKNNIPIVAEKYSTNNGLPSDKVRALFWGSGNVLWIGTKEGGLAKYQNQKIFNFDSKIGSSNSVTAIFEDHQGILWIGTINALYKMKQSENTLITLEKKLENCHIRCIGYDHLGKLMVGTGNGLFFYKKNKFEKLIPKIKCDVLNYLSDKKGNLWIGTNGKGLILLKQGDPMLITEFNYKNGFPNNYIFSLNQDNSGNLYIGTLKGVFRIAKKDLEKYSHNPQEFQTKASIIKIDDKEGMPSNECLLAGYPSSCLISQKGNGETLLFPTLKGIALVYSHQFPNNQYSMPPNVIIEDVIVDNQSKIHLSAQPSFSSNTQLIEFIFTAIYLTAPEKTKIFYRLDGFDTQWQNASKRLKSGVFYLNLPPNKYCFKVIAYSNNGIWNYEGAQYKFEILKPFSNRHIFYLITIFGLMLTLAIIILIITNQKKKNKSKKKYKTSALLPETVEHVLPVLNQLMEKNKIYLKPDLTLKKLADNLHIHYNHLSQIINEKLGKSFNDYINQYRIEEAKRILADPKESKKVILEIAYDTGFYSKSVFNTAFKKFTGMTPTQYKKNCRK